jgi:SMODS-associating 4TM effector domain
LNSIPEEQNEIKQLDRIAASSQLYIEAKRLLGISMILSIPVPLVWATVIAAFPALKIYGAIWGIAVTLLDRFILNPAQKKLQVQAAKVQQQFDCDLFQLDWENFHNIGHPLEPEIIYSAKRKFNKKDSTYSKLKDWYPVIVGQIPLAFARLVCQRTNCWWDAEQRRKYSNWVIAILIILSILMTLIGCIGGFSLEKFFLVVVLPLLPAFVLGISQYVDNMNAAKILDKKKQEILGIWSEALSNAKNPNKLHDFSIQMQDAIFKNRSTSPLLFNWIYSIWREDNQDSMNSIAKGFIAEVQKKIKPLDA